MNEDGRKPSPVVPPCAAVGRRAVVGLAVLMAVVAIAFTFDCGRAGAQTPPAVEPPPDDAPVPLTLADAVFIALRYNRTIESAYLNRVVQRYDLRVAEDKFKPKLTLAVGADVIRAITPNSAATTYAAAWSPTVSWLTPTGAQFTFGWANTVSAGDLPSAATSVLDLAVVQPLLRGGGTDVNRASVTVARINEQANRLALRNTLISTITTVIQAYRSFLQARDQVGIARDALARSRELLAVNQELVTAGRMAEVDVVQTEANIASNELAVVQAENSHDGARLRLLQELDIDGSTRIEPVEKLDADRVDVTYEAALGYALANRTDYLQAVLQQDVGRINLMLARDGRMWELNVRAGATFGSGQRGLRSAVERTTDDNRNFRAGIELRIPIGDLSLEQRVVQAQIGLQQTEINLEEQRQSISISVRDAVRNVDLTWRSLALARRSRELSERKLQIEREKLRAGRSSNFQVLSFETDLNNARNSELGAIVNYLNALTTLDQTLGSTLETWQIELKE